MRTLIRPRLAAASLVCASALAGATHVRAVTIEAAAQGQVGGVVDQDQQGPAAAGELQAGVAFENATQIDLDGEAVAQATQNDQGVAAVKVDGAYSELADNQLSATTRWSTTVVNNRNFGIEYVYSFFIVPPKLTFLDLAETAAPAIEAEWHIEVRVNGNILFESHAKLVGNSHTAELQTSGTSLSPRPFASGALSGYEFDGYDDVVSLGFYQPGGSVTVETVLTASTRVWAPGHGARAEIGDPLKLGSDPGISGVVMESEPVGVERRTFGGVKALYRR